MSDAPPVLWLSTDAVQLTVPIGNNGQLMSDAPPCDGLQLTVPTGDGGQLMSDAPPVLWLSTNAVQLTVPVGDNSQQMSDAPAVLWLYKRSPIASSPAARSFPFFSCIRLFRS